jgi:ribosomal protein L17
MDAAADEEDQRRAAIVTQEEQKEAIRSLKDSVFALQKSSPITILPPATTETSDPETLRDMNDAIITLRRDLTLKANAKDMINLISQQHNEELFEQIQSTYDQFVDFKSTQNSLNQKLCANNCVARWYFRSADLISIPKRMQFISENL